MLQHTIEDLGLGQSFLICFQVASIIMAQGFEKVKYNFPSSVIQSTTHLASGKIHYTWTTIRLAYEAEVPPGLIHSWLYHGPQEALWKSMYIA